MRVRNLPLWALLTCIPVALFALNCGPANLNSDQVAMNDDLTNVVGNDVAAKDMAVDHQAVANSDDLTLDEGATDEWRGWGRGGWGRGWGRGFGRGWGWGGGWGGWGWGNSWWPWSYGYSYPYYSYWPYTLYSGWYW